MRMMSIAAVAASLSLSGAIAQEVTITERCGTLDEMKDLVVRDYEEQPVAGGVSFYGSVMQLFANERTGTWSVLITSIATGETCIADFGENFMRARVKPDA